MLTPSYHFVPSLNKLQLWPQTTQITPYTNFYEFAAAASARTIASGTAQPSHFYAKSLVFKQQTLIPDSVVHAAFEYLNTTTNGTDLYAISFNWLYIDLAWVYFFCLAVDLQSLNCKYQRALKTLEPFTPLVYT
ncbi:hypothetical protein V1523DRAFT_139576 [Lipomyces doorenjongii]